MFEDRMTAFRTHLEQAGLDVALITDDDNVYYLTGYCDYLHMDFGRPTILVVPRDGPSVLITPMIDFNTAAHAARVDRIAPWNDGMGEEWRTELPALLAGAARVGLEPDQMPPVVRSYADTLVGPEGLISVRPVLERMRMIKSEDELRLARHAGQVANAMMDAGRAAIGDGVPEYE
ncbi:MAG: aminopeptidase P family N-terminal domain-containing protein, partial [Pseudomonadota bacterium]